MAIESKFSDFSNLDKERLLAAANERLPFWITFLLVVLIAWQFARMFWMLMPGSPIGDPVTAPGLPGAGAPTRGQPAGRIDIAAIAGAHLFGEASDEPMQPLAGPAAPIEELAETRLALTLKGTMAGSTEKLTVAIIADNRNEENVYTIGDAITAGASLHSVYADRVVLNRNGVLEVLKLPQEFPKTTAPVMRQQTSMNRTADEPSMQSIQELVTENATKLADVIRPTPYFEGGQQQGYRVYPGRDRKMFAALGLRPGDLIKDIDGQALTDPQQAMQIFQSLGEANQVSVTVERNGQPEVLVLSTSQLNLENDQ